MNINSSHLLHIIWNYLIHYMIFFYKLFSILQVTSALILSKVAQKVVLFLTRLSSWLPTPQCQFLDVRFRFVPSLVLHWELFECMPNVSTKTTAILNPWFRRPQPILFAKLEVRTLWNAYQTNFAMISSLFKGNTTYRFQ